MTSGSLPDSTTSGHLDMRVADRLRDLSASERHMVAEAVDMASYIGPATIVTPRGEVEVIVYLRSGSDSDDHLTWGGHIEGYAEVS